MALLVVAQASVRTEFPDRYLLNPQTKQEIISNLDFQRVAGLQRDPLKAANGGR
jgi:hypothetical protein